MFKSALIFTTSLFLLFTSANFVRAAITVNLPETAVAIPIDDTGILPGMLVIVDPSGKYTLSHQEYDPNLMGVVVSSAALSLTDTTQPQNRLVASTGPAAVLVSAEAGPIKIGDSITSGTIAGYGMRADKAGIVVGQALQAFGSEDNKSEKGEILVDVGVRYFPGILSGKNAEFFTMLGSSILALFSKNQMVFLEQSAKMVKAILAAIIAIVAIGFSFLNFGKAARSGIEASGRNPLAGKLITASITLNVVLTVLAGVFGVALAYLIFVI